MRHLPWFTLRALLGAALVLWIVPSAHAQGSALTGKVTRAGAAEPMGGAAVVIEELRREARTADDGSYRFDNLAPGNYHVSVRAEGYSSRRTEVTIGTGPATLDLEVDLDLHFAEVLSVSPNPRPQFESYQPTSVLSADDLARQLQDTIGATLQSEPGVSMRSLGPGPARPVIRGLDGDRVLVLQDGQRMGDLSSQSGDHGVPVNPASAQRIEVVRGPATLLYGANAIGGLVNVVTDQIPTEKVTTPTGSFTFNLGSNNTAAGGAGDVHVGNGRFALHLGGGGQRSESYHTPDGEVENSQSRSGFVNVGGGWTGERQYAGVSYGYDDTKYGVPVLEEGSISLTPKRHAFSARAGGQGLSGAFTSYRATLGVRRYTHAELEGDEVGTEFKNNTVEGEVMVSHRPAGRLSGSVGGWFLNRDFSAEGAEALSPPVDQRGFAAFLYEEVDVAALHAAVRRPRRPYAVRAAAACCLTATSLNTPTSLGALVPPASRQRQLRGGGQPGPRRAKSRARGAVLLRPAPREPDLRDWQPRPGGRAGAGVRRVAAGPRRPAARRGHGLP